MKKILFISFIVSIITIIASCDYDDSNDIDIIKPNDTTQTETNLHKLTNTLSGIVSNSGI